MSGTEAVYVLCFATCLICVALLIRAWFRNRQALLFWTATSLVFLAINNLLVVLDLMILPGSDLLFWRSLAALAACATLIYGCVWESER